MSDAPTNRRLAAILAADVVGYSSLMEDDEAATLNRLKSRRQDVLVPLLKRYGGRIVKLMGDGLLAEFGSAIHAAQFAMDLQAGMESANASEPSLAPITLRIGINVGDVMVEGSDLYGDGVNVAARLEAVAEPGAIYISKKVQEELRGKITVSYVDLGDVALKNIAVPVRVFRIAAVDSDSPLESSVSFRPTIIPSLTVLPFKYLGGTSEDPYFSEGIAEDILTDLSRFKNLRIVGRSTAPNQKGREQNHHRLAAEAGADYLAEGTVRNVAGSLRVTIQLSEAATGSRVWSERYDAKPEETDRVVASIVMSLEQRMVAVGAARARLKPASNWTAVDHLLLGRDLCNAYREPDAIPYFQKAVAIDQTYAQAHAWLALAKAVTFMINAERRLLEEAGHHCRTALGLDSNDSTVHHANGMVALWSGEHRKAGHHYDRAGTLNPADIQIRADRANWLRYCGRLDEALIEIDAAIAHSLTCPPWFWGVRGEILFDMRRYAEALASFSNVPSRANRLMYEAAAHAYLGNSSRARNMAGEVRASVPDLTVEDVRITRPHTDPDTHTHLIDGLKLAGVLS